MQFLFPQHKKATYSYREEKKEIIKEREKKICYFFLISQYELHVYI